MTNAKDDVLPVPFHLNLVKQPVQLVADDVRQVDTRMKLVVILMSNAKYVGLVHFLQKPVKQQVTLANVATLIITVLKREAILVHVVHRDGTIQFQPRLLAVTFVMIPVVLRANFHSKNQPYPFTVPIVPPAHFLQWQVKCTFAMANVREASIHWKQG